ncbi:MAG: hypothetical protein CMP48_21515 [Rickettsiales bacterium]|nr:hypothetical protein [Rickettsiales bacterium]
MEPGLKKYFDQLEENKKVTWQMLEGVDADMFQWKKDEHTWSLSQVMDHVIFSEASALRYCQKKMLAGDQIPDATLFNTVKIRLYFWALQTKLKFKAPKPISKPDNSKSVEELKDLWNQTRADYIGFLDNYPDKYLNKAVFRHPLAGRIRLDEMLRFLNTHIIHHQYQINRIIDSYERVS